jgi:hypothetical protein
LNPGTLRLYNSSCEWIEGGERCGLKEGDMRQIR